MIAAQYRSDESDANSPSQSSPERTLNILIADNDRIATQSLLHCFDLLGHRCQIAGSFDEALRLLRDQHFDIVVVGCAQGNTDGKELCQWWRSRKGACAYTYFMLMSTSQVLELVRSDATSWGVDDFLTKPIDPTQVSGRLLVASRIIQMQAQLQESAAKVDELDEELRKQHAKLGEVLVAHGAITPEQLSQALEQQSSSGQRLGRVLLSNGWADEEAITKARGVQLDVPYVDICKEKPDPEAVLTVRPELARQYALIPLRIEKDSNSQSGAGSLILAMVDPWNIEAIDQVQRETRRRVQAVIASESGIKLVLERVYRWIQPSSHEAMLVDTPEDSHLADFANVSDVEDQDLAEIIRQSDQAPVIRFVNAILTDAVSRRASDIHIEARKKDLAVLYRIDGRLQVGRTAPRKFLAPVASRIKVMAEMDIAEKRLPLDGRIALKVAGKSVDLRVSTMPTQFGERVVLRILDRGSATLSLNDLGFSKYNSDAFVRLIKKPHGLLLVTGPTGSGKTTTLYAALNALKEQGLKDVYNRRNILTVEDPIEYELEGISQSSINERAGLTFARQLRAILRQDPDVILVGEIRDSETAEIALRAAMTGHLVFATLHCNEASSAVSRLVEMGLAPFLIASTLIGVVAQRLARKLCPHCRQPVDDTNDDLALFLDEIGADKSKPYFAPAGCEQCDDLGSRGRMAVHEVLVCNRAIQRLIMVGADSAQIRESAMESGMRSMLEDGLEKAQQGQIPLMDLQSKIGATLEQLTLK